MKKQSTDGIEKTIEDMRKYKKVEKIKNNYMKLFKSSKISLADMEKKQEISEAKDKVAIDNIPYSISKIIDGLISGTLNVVKARITIDEEAERRLHGKDLFEYQLEKEQEKNQIILQIRRTIVERASLYYIMDPQSTIMKLHELSNTDLESSIAIVVKNLVRRKEFDRAEEVCNSFSGNNRESEIYKNMKKLQKEVNEAEIGDAVLKGINMNGTIGEEVAYFSLIEKGLRYGNVKLNSVSLGKSEDGSKNIVLSDVWPLDELPIYR